MPGNESVGMIGSGGPKAPIFEPKGLWSPAPKTQVSRETQELLKTMMAESRLTAFQRRQLNEAARTIGSLPSQCNPTTSRKPAQPSPPKPPRKTVNPRNCGRGIRLQEEIAKSGAYNRERYRTIPCKVRTDEDKEKFANLMAFGTDLEPELGRAREPSPEPLVPAKDRFEELVEEIRERKEFLDEMTSLGEGKRYKSKIETEISQMIREMEEIDRQRSEQLRRLGDEN